MARFRAVSGWSAMALLFAACMVGLFEPTTAQARVGVTSATSGDPLGKPPAQPERILRIGIDVQANELVSTGANDRAHLVFLDGTALTVGPNARLVIDKFVYDPSTKVGDLAIKASRGVFRLVGGKISKSHAITITTPSSTIGVRGGICVFDVGPGYTMATFAFGISMTVTGQGQTQTVTRPGSQVATLFGHAPGQPTLAPQGSLVGMFSALEGTGGQGGTPPGTGTQSAQDFSRYNSGQGPGFGQPPSSSTGNPSQDGNTATDAISDTGTQQQQQQAEEQRRRAPTRTTRTLSGYVGGLIDSVDSSDGTSTRQLGMNAVPPGNVSLSTNADTGIVSATITVPGWDGSGNPANSATFDLGGTSGSSVFLSDDTYVVVSTSASVTQNGHTSSGSDVASLTLLASSGVLSLNGFIASQNVTPCTCQYLTWGLWLGGIDYSANSVFNPGGEDALNFASYVAGTLTTTVQLPNTGVATYTGHMLGNVNNSGNSSYLVAGTYSNTWSFASQTGAVTASFDGAGFHGTTALSSGTVNFATTAPIASTGAAGRSLTLNGSFFSAPTGANAATAYQAGRFGVTGANYQASGTFAAQRQ